MIISINYIEILKTIHFDSFMSFFKYFFVNYIHWKTDSVWVLIWWTRGEILTSSVNNSTQWSPTGDITLLSNSISLVMFGDVYSVLDGILTVSYNNNMLSYMIAMNCISHSNWLFSYLVCMKVSQHFKTYNYTQHSVQTKLFQFSVQDYFKVWFGCLHVSYVKLTVYKLCTYIHVCAV